MRRAILSDRTSAAAVFCLAFLVLAAGFAARVRDASADSIWDRRHRSAAYLYTDNLATDLGDSLTVLIAEESTFTMDGKRASEKSTEHTGSINLETALVDLTWPAAKAAQQSSRKIEGNHEHTGRREFVDSVTVTVVDKLPNDNLVVAGRTERLIAGERVVTILTGIVKQEDISGVNTVSSARVAFLKIFYETQGPSSSYTDEGYLNKILNVLWPF